ncbi:MAG TPA: hypothetical protein DCZ94_22765 [Lentisphaeria bacterium]|nr:MAG: hypothetical protein A2X48_14005 [Lentisphaerae bacterium GWF2_49_21]HBC89771.1 hypothetical protein [Lentisphaeria bacterium]
MDDNNRLLVEILKNCLKLDSQAYLLYNKIGGCCSDENQRIFWNRLAEDEKDHVEFWSKAQKLAEKELLPNVFEDPAATLQKFEKLLQKVLYLIKGIKDYSNMSETLAIAYRLEFHMLSPEFATMFHIFRNLEGIDNIEDEYDRHIEGFIASLMKFGDKVPEAEMLGETLQTLWTDYKRLAKESACDLLTGLLNRRGFFNAVNPVVHLASRKKFKVVFLIADVDHFKNINDTHGHHRGDEVLKFIASIIESSLRESDIVGRHGGEEFIVYADCKDPDSINLLCEKIRKNVEEKTEAALGFKVTVSIGASSGFIGNSVEQEMMALIHRADQNLYKAKADGRNKIVCL